MLEPHVYKDETGVEWKRLWVSPQANVTERLDPFDVKGFVRKTGDMKGTLGDLFDQSKEASEQRKSILGHDPVQQQYLREWGKKRGGRVHPMLENG